MLKRVSLILVSLAVFTVGAFAQVIDRPAATVNLTKPEYISVSQLDQRVQQLNTIRQQNGLPIPLHEKKQVLDSMINGILVKQAAEKAGISVTQSELDDAVNKQKTAVERQIGPMDTQQFHTVIQQQTGLTWTVYQQQLKTQLLEQKYILQVKGEQINNVPAPSEQQVQDKYNEIANRLTNPEIVRFSQIFFDTRNLTQTQKEKAHQLADKVYRDYVNGTATFKQLVQEYTQDQQARYNGGDFGYLARDDQRAQSILGQNFMNEVFALKTGQVSKVLQSKIGYHIVKITEHYPPKLLTLSDPISPANPMTVREYITQGLEQQEKSKAFNDAVKQILDNLKKQAEIKIYDQNLK